MYIANRFAHEDRDITPDKPLDNTSMTAFNLGWLDRHLAPGENWRIAYALGRADNPDPETLPTKPEIPDRQWSFDSPWQAKTTGGLPLRFVGERIRLELDPPYVTVTGEFVFKNRNSSSLAVTLQYPFPIDEQNEFPDLISVEGIPFEKTDAGISFILKMEPYGTRTVNIRYRQKFSGNSARYILTTTRRWGHYLDWGIYQSTWPETLGKVKVSLSNLASSRQDGRVHVETRRMNFMPESDFVLTHARETSSPLNDSHSKGEGLAIYRRQALRVCLCLSYRRSCLQV